MAKKTREAAQEQSDNGKKNLYEETEIVEFDPMKDFAPEENLEGVKPQLPEIKIAHQSAKYDMPDGSTVASFTGTIVHVARCNTLWGDMENEPPICMSMDGIKPIPSSSQKALVCDERVCPFNQFKPVVNKKGETVNRKACKACKNEKRIHILIPGESMPAQLKLTPMSLKSGDKYLLELTRKGVNYKIVDTEFSLESKSNGSEKYSIVKMTERGYVWGGQIVPQFVFERVDRNGIFVSEKRPNPNYRPIWTEENKATAARIQSIREQWIEVMTQSPVDDADYPDITENPESENNEE